MRVLYVPDVGKYYGAKCLLHIIGLEGCELESALRISKDIPMRFGKKCILKGPEDMYTCS